MTPSDEFAGIARPRSRQPMLAIAVVVLAGYLVFHERDELKYALSSSTPQQVGDVRGWAGQSLATLPVNQMVRIAGLPDRESAVILDMQGSWRFTQFFRLLGTGSRVFVRRAPDPLPVDLASQDVFTGRLVRMADLSFAQSIRDHFSRNVTATHIITPAAFKAALRDSRPPFVVMDVAGEKVSLAAGDEIEVDVERPGEIAIDLPRARFAGGIDAARAAITTRGGAVESFKETADRFTISARFPDEKRDVALSEIGDIDRAVRIRPARDTVAVSIADLISSPAVLSNPSMTGVRTIAPVQIPADAVLLLEGDRPADHLKTVLVVAFLLAFAAVNLLALRRPGRSG